MMFHVPMCKWCGEREVGAMAGSDSFCSDKCLDAYNQALADEAEALGVDDEDVEDMGMGDQFGEAYFDDVNSGRYDDDPSPYGGTYSEE